MLVCAVLTADSVSWFQLHNATKAKPIEAEVVRDAEAGNAAAQNALSELDSDYLNSRFTKVYCETCVKLHVYGVRSGAQSEPQSGSMPSQPLKTAIADATKTVTDDLCGPSTVLLASTSTAGIFSAYKA